MLKSNGNFFLFLCPVFIYMVVDKSLAVVDIVRLPYLALFNIWMLAPLSLLLNEKKAFAFLENCVVCSCL